MGLEERIKKDRIQKRNWYCLQENNNTIIEKKKKYPNILDLFMSWIVFFSQQFDGFIYKAVIVWQSITGDELCHT